MSYELWFKCDGQHVSALCQSLQQAAVLWDALNASGEVEMTQKRPLRASAFNPESRAKLHSVMDRAVSINSATTGWVNMISNDNYAMMGCIDAPEYVPSGSTESFSNWNGDVPISTTFNRRWMR